MISESRYRIRALVATAAVSFGAGPAGAQTWAHERSTPAPRELVAVDATGEPAWLFGAEDVAGDGLGTFEAEERAIDLRSAYAAVDQGKLWLRAYVADDDAPERLRLHVFIDADRNPATGGPQRAPEISADLAQDPARGGYEAVLLLAGEAANEGFAGAWRWAEDAGEFEPLPDPEALEAVAELGTDRDPLFGSGDDKGYRQLALRLNALAIDAACSAALFFRGSDADGLADRDLGELGPCVPADANDNGLSDVAETDDRCDSDAQCPAGGVCSENRCVAPDYVPAAGEVVQGGALSCAVIRPARSELWPVLAAVAALATLARRRGYAVGRRRLRP